MRTDYAAFSALDLIPPVEHALARKQAARAEP
jgi:hypothetical protein